MRTFDIGAVSVTRIPHFENLPLTPAELLPGTGPDLWEANRSWLAPDHWDPGSGRVRVSVHSWLLRSAGRTILIDTGLAPDPRQEGVPAGGDLPAALAAAGVAPGDVDLVVCTHLHADHVGWNTREDDGEHVPFFPRARYLLSAADLAFFAPDTLVEEPGRSAAVHARSVEPVLRSGQAVVWEDRFLIDENLRLDLAPGHTPGHGVLAVESEGERALFVGDLLHTPVQLLAPDASSCFCHDPSAAARTRRRVLERAADTAALVVPAHFCGPGAVEIGRDGTRFTARRWVP
ncbi:MBL fold metallo-hydrolase [Spirillospora sp. NPDC046719]